MDHWDRRFLELAGHIAQWSKDPSTKVGAVICDANKRIVSVGFNGLPVRVTDFPERYDDSIKKNEMIVHGEMNAILFAGRSLIGLGCTLYTYPFLPCSRCASMVVQAGIRKVVTPRLTKHPEHWMHASAERTRLLFNEAQVLLQEVDFNLTLMVRSDP